MSRYGEQTEVAHVFSMGFACISSDAIDFLPSTRVRIGIPW